jgi:hypothetical protein
MKYLVIKDYPLAGLRVGKTVDLKMKKLPTHLKPYLEPAEQAEEEEDEVPDEAWNKADIVKWLASNGVEGATGTKEELLKEVKKVSKGK